MTEKKLYLIVQSVVCVLLVILLAASAVSIYREGKARKAEDPMESIYTAEKAAEKFRPIAPLFFGSFGLTAAGWILAVKDDSAESRSGIRSLPVISLSRVWWIPVNR